MHPKNKAWAGKLPGRCKNCKGRRPLSMRPEHYITPPRCKHCGCNEWFVDWHRLTNPNSSRGGEVCKADCLPYPHRVNTKQCKHYEEHILNQAIKGTSGGLVSEDEEKPPF